MLPTRISVVARPEIATAPGVVGAKPGESAGEGWSHYELAIEPGMSSESVLEHCTANGIGVRRFEEHRASLHEVFVELVGDAGVKQ